MDGLLLNTGGGGGSGLGARGGGGGSANAAVQQNARMSMIRLIIRLLCIVHTPHVVSHYSDTGRASNSPALGST